MTFRDMNRNLLTLATLGLLALSACGGDSEEGVQPTFNSILSGAEEVPPVTTEAEGRAAIGVDSNTGEISIVVVTSGIDKPTAAHLHSEFAGANGMVIFALTQSAGDPGTFTGSTTFTPEQLELLGNGGVYVNVHSEAHPSGELRGQVLGNNVIVTRFPITGEQENPAIETEHTGSVAFTQLANGRFELRGRYNVNDATMAHIHTGPVGINGPVIVGLQLNAEAMTFRNPAAAILDSDQQEALANGGLYVNLHSTTVPSGELRGQIESGTQLPTFRLGLSGDEEVPLVTTDASGRATLDVDSETGEVDVLVVTNGIATPTAAHLHTEFAGANGMVIFPLTQNATNPGTFSGITTLTADQLSKLNDGGIYVNVHSEAVPSGELRGQVLGSDVTVLRFPLQGDQENPPVTTGRTGSVAFTKLGDGRFELRGRHDLINPTGAHIHTGSVGSNGPVIITLDRDNMSMTFRNPADVTLDSGQQQLLTDGGLYVNLHSAEFPGGELRGQIQEAAPVSE